MSDVITVQVPEDIGDAARQEFAELLDKTVGDEYKVLVVPREYNFLNADEAIAEFRAAIEELQ